MKNINELTALIKTLNPLETLSILALYLGVENENRRELSEAGLELIQYIFLTEPHEEPLLVPTTDEIIRLRTLANTIYEDYLQSRATRLGKLDFNDGRFWAERARAGAQDYRN